MALAADALRWPGGRYDFVDEPAKGAHVCDIDLKMLDAGFGEALDLPDNIGGRRPEDVEHLSGWRGNPARPKSATGGS